MKNFWITTQCIQASGNVGSLCNAITFINTSLIDTIYVLNVPVLPQQSLSIEGNENEIDTTDYLVRVGTDPNTLFCIRKFYKNG